MILSFSPWLTIIPAYVKPINAHAAMWYHVPFTMLPKKGVADHDLCLHQLQLIHVQMHEHTGIKDFIATYV